VAGAEAERSDAEYGVNGLYLAAVALEFPHPCCADETDKTDETGEADKIDDIGAAPAGPVSIPEGGAVAGRRMRFEVGEPDKFQTLRQREQRRWDKFYGGTAGAGTDAGDGEEAGQGPLLIVSEM
jgi:hypothetical protein